MKRYRVDEKVFKERLTRLGFSSVSEFATANKINRATLGNYFSGKGPLPESFYAIADALQVDALSLLIPTLSETQIPNIEEIAAVIKKCAEIFPDAAVLLLGSRATGDEKKYSDWDIAVTGGESPISNETFLKMKRAVDDLAEDLPRAVDLINLDVAPQWFLKKINYAPRFLGGNRNGMSYFMGVLNGIQKVA